MKQVLYRPARIANPMALKHHAAPQIFGNSIMRPDQPSAFRLSTMGPVLSPSRCGPHLCLKHFSERSTCSCGTGAKTAFDDLRAFDLTAKMKKLLCRPARIWNPMALKHHAAPHFFCNAPFLWAPPASTPSGSPRQAHFACPPRALFYLLQVCPPPVFSALFGAIDLLMWNWCQDGLR